MRVLIVCTSAIAMLLGVTTVSAEQRALLVGVGKYEMPGIDLPAIDLDLERMRETLIIMGFEDEQIRSLLDEQSTSENVVREFKTWLKEGVRPEDRVVFYYSGHGSNNPDFDGDEDDGVDEVLVTHDAKIATRDGERLLSGVVDDDTLARLIADIPSDNIWFIADACHSGTVTRGLVMNNLSLGGDPIFTRSLTYSGMPQGTASGFSREIGKATDANFVSMSAAGDQEQAIGTSAGGVFTIGFTEAIKAAAKSGRTVTIMDLRDAAADYIRRHVDESRVHTPQVTGNDLLAKGALNIVPLVEGNGPNRKKVVNIVAEQHKPFELAAEKKIYAIDEPVQLSLSIPMDGYLNVITVDSQDNATVLFPNRYHSDHAVKQGQFRIPTAKMAFELPASEPIGSTVVVAFVTSDPIDFYQNSLDERNTDGSINVDFSSMSHTATRAIRVAPRKKEMHAARIDIEVVRH